MWRATLLAAAAIAMPGCGGRIDPEPLAQDAWRFDDEAGTLGQFRDAFPQAQPRLSEIRQRYSLNLRPDYDWSVEVDLPRGHRLRASCKIPRDAIEADSTTIKRAESLKFTLLSRDGRESRELNGEEFRAVVAVRGDAAVVRGAVTDLELDLPPLDESALEANLLANQPWFDRLRQAFPNAQVQFTRVPFSRHGDIWASVSLGKPIDEHGLYAFVLSRSASCLYSADGKSIEVVTPDVFPAQKLQCDTTRWITGGHGQRSAIHDTLDVQLSDEQFDEIVARRGETALLERLAAEELQRRAKLEGRPVRRTVQP